MQEESGSDREPAGGARDRDMELQVTFGGGLDQLQQRLQSKREAALNQKTDTVWQAYLRRRRREPPAACAGHAASCFAVHQAAAVQLCRLSQAPWCLASDHRMSRCEAPKAGR